jgi:hypothetical protein
MGSGSSRQLRALAVIAGCILLGICGFCTPGHGAAEEGAMKPSTEKVGQETAGVTSGGVLFEVITDRVWKIPPIEDREGTLVNLALRITNRTKTPLRFNKFDTVRLALFTPAGESLPFSGGRNAVRGGEGVSPPVLPGQNLAISRQARLVWLKNGTLRLIGSEEIGGIWYFDGLGPGKYKVQFIYENLKAEIGDLDAFWTGRVSTPLLEVKLK